MARPIVTFPGKLGDMIFAAPAMRAVRDLYRERIGLVYTGFCAAGVSLLEAQHDLIEPGMVWRQEAYRAVAVEPGMQPHRVEPPEEVFTDGRHDVIHLGLRRYPLPHETIVTAIANFYRLKVKPGPWLAAPAINPTGHLVMHAPVNDSPYAVDVLRWLLTDRQLEKWGGPQVHIVGAASEFVSYQKLGLDRIEGVRLFQVSSMLDVWEHLNGARGFAGLASGPAVVAAGSGVPCAWVLRPGVDSRWVPDGCDVRIESGPT